MANKSDKSDKSGQSGQWKNDHSYYGVATEPWTPAGNLNVMRDTERMTSPEAQAARARTEEIMAALKKGEPGDADKLMGDADFRGKGIFMPNKEKLVKMFSKKEKKDEAETSQPSK